MGKLKHPGPLLTTHRDPFDRLLAAQALRKKLRLVSSDAAFAQFSGLDVLW